MTASGLMDALRPFLWLTLAAFLAGVLSYAVLGRPQPGARARVVYVPAASAPASDAWNLPKRV
jgi:hypothetical protein